MTNNNRAETLQADVAPSVADVLGLDDMRWDDDAPAPVADRSLPLSEVAAKAADLAVKKIAHQNPDDPSKVPSVEAMAHTLEHFGVRDVHAGIVSLMADLQVLREALEGDPMALATFGESVTGPADLCRVLINSGNTGGRIFVRTSIARDTNEDVRANAEVSYPMKRGAFLETALIVAGPNSLPRKGKGAAPVTVTQAPASE